MRKISCECGYDTTRRILQIPVADTRCSYVTSHNALDRRMVGNKGAERQSSMCLLHLISSYMACKLYRVEIRLLWCISQACGGKYSVF